MGVTQSTNIINQPTKYEEKINIITHVEDNEEEVFSKISNLTKEILIKYSDMHLDENFCNNLSIIYQDKLNTFKIKLLRDIYNKISGKKIQYDLLLVNKYADKNDDKFKVEDDLKVGIEELFFNQNIKFNSTYLSQIELFDPNINIQDIFKKTITNKKYIDGSINFSSMLNDKLRFKLSKKNENNGNNKEEEKLEEDQEQDQEQEEKEENNNSYSGGGNRNYLLQKNNRQIRQPYNKQKQFEQKYNKPPFKQQYKEQKQFEQKYNRPPSFKQPYKEQKSYNNQKYIKPYKEQEQSFQKFNKQIQNKKNQNEELNKLLENNLLKNNNVSLYPTIKNNNNNENNEIPNNLYSIQPNEIPLNSQIENQSILKNNNNSIPKNLQLINSSKEIPQQSTNTNIVIAKLKQNLNNARREKNLLLQMKEQQKIELPEQKQPFNKQQEQNKRNNRQKQNLSQQKETNIYSVPKNFKVKNPCNGKDICYLNKKQICELISQHFIVRNNIIAAILSCIPRKVGNNYEGGICYQQFINLNNCKVCIPENYKDLLNSNNKNKDKSKTLKFIQDIATASLNLTKEACKENNGTYYNLSKSQEIALVDKAESNKMNAFFFVCRKKIKEVYLDNLKLLIEILNKLNETSVINNATLNIISNDTKTIIDRMYTLCQYYYIYAIISLLNADITTTKKEKGNTFIKGDLKQFV
jgi:hypothetical protein